ncbi:hypothetical protein AURANDRAFT_62216 [Aureococcus anophagefferens]|uniref:Uncharacterized protein n=1 Tax=Aureococcus anophagefferens TaxID=44056 RepID=F0Y2S3_AURAN|nr:hypothetical protein AURANDRAFT_62216 [Aureococcus anophagefferens]EGB10749.1 hypothetical protein AURANDRAFT_62216 [Aureococcus anophagefferens]|eukprot:XP_009034338.1 hypothetical protein AURANDRAFT_62216 [Aureococcus anophagefferens]
MEALVWQKKKPAAAAPRGTDTKVFAPRAAPAPPDGAAAGARGAAPGSPAAPGALPRTLGACGARAARELQLTRGDVDALLRAALAGGDAQGSTRERNSQLQRLRSRPFSTRDAEAAIGRVERACVGRFLRGKQSKLYFLGVVVRASCPLDEPRRMRFTVDAGGPLPAGDGDAPRFVELAQGQVSNDCVGDAEFAAWRSRALEHLTDEELARPLDAPEAALKPSDLRPLAVPVCGPWVGAAFDAPLDLSKARGRDSPALLLDDAPLRDDLPPAFLDELPFRLDDADDDVALLDIDGLGAFDDAPAEALAAPPEAGPRRRRRKIPKSIVDEICDSDGGSVYEDVDDDDASDDVRAASRAALPEKKPGAKDPPTVVSDESPVSTVRGPHSDSSFLEPPDTPPPPGLGADRRRKRKENLADLENRVRRIGTKVRVARAPGTPRAEVIKIPSGMRTFVLVKMLEGADGGKECLYMPSELILDE